MKRQVLFGVIVLAAVIAAAWLWTMKSGQPYSEDPQVAELEKLRDDAVARHPEMTEDQRRAERSAFGERMQGLTPEQRMAFFESSAPIFVSMAAKRFEVEYDKFMKLSPEEQQRELDKRIDEMEKRGAGGRPGGPGGFAGPGGGAAGRGNGGGDNGRPPIPPEKRDEFRKKMLDWTTPSQRAKFENGVRIFNQRREERGLPPVGRPGGGLF